MFQRNNEFPSSQKAIFKRLKILRENSETKIGLIIGRSDNEQLPSKKGWIWVSLSLEKRIILPTKRFHIKGDINTKALQSNLKKIGFDVVIVDWSTIKFIYTPWITLKSFLKIDDKSILITELITGISYPTFGSWKYKPYGFDIQENIIEMKPNWTKFEREEHIKKFEHATIEYLKTLFNKVEYKKRKEYPTREGMIRRQEVYKFLKMTKPNYFL
jgi:hypothetical protein